MIGNTYRTNLTFDTLKQELESIGAQIKIEENQAYNYLLTDALSGEKFFYDKYVNGIQLENFKEFWSKYDGKYFDGIIEDVRIITGTNKECKPTKGLSVTVDVPEVGAYMKVYYALEGYDEQVISFDANDLVERKAAWGDDWFQWVGTTVTCKYNIKGDYDHYRIYPTKTKEFEKPDYSPYQGMTCPVIGDISIKYEGTSKTGADFAIFACDFKCGPTTSHVEIFQSKNPAVGTFGKSQLDDFNRIKSAISRGIPASVTFKDPKWPKLKFDYPKKGAVRETAGMRLSQIRSA